MGSLQLLKIGVFGHEQSSGYIKGRVVSTQIELIVAHGLGEFL
jgi:hypothetical protein